MKIKQTYEQKKASEKLVNQIKRVKEQNEKSNPALSEQKNKENAYEYYSNLSNEEKMVFQRELEKKKLRDSYVAYLKYVYPDFIVTRFHAMLSNICESVVRKVEAGQSVRVLLSVPPQHGKLLANETPILTRNGWKNHGDLVVGDEVLNDKGDFVKIINVFPKDIANCKVYFTNGETILCNENHEWVVFDRTKHKIRIAETKEIETRVEEGNIKSGRGHRFTFQLPNKNFIKGEHKNLYVNPYVLGVWLGDGTNIKPYICASKQDEITLLECGKFYKIDKTYIHKTTGVITKSYLGLRQDLQKYGMCKSKQKTEKHIPIEYLTASIEQRLELLAGLIDTDGYVDHKHNRIVFTTADIELKNTFEDLIATFGWRTTTCKCEPTISTSGIEGKKTYYQIGFNPTIIIPCRIPRKRIEHFSKQRKISICKVERIKPIEGNCIQVEGGIYLCGRTMIPTHNSTVVTKTLPSWFVGRNPKRWAILTAYNADIAEEFSDNNRQLIKNHGAEIFGIETNTSQDNKTLFQVHKIGDKEIPSSDSGIMGVGISGGITGHGGSLIIVDDPYKNSTEAENPNIRANISRVFKDSVLTRARGKGNAVIVIHTRWNEDDLIGELEKTGDWITINIPCVWEKGIDKLLHRKVGETLCPELGFDGEWAMRTEKAVGKRVWNALYQGKPYSDNGEMVSRDNIKFYDKKSKPLAFEEITLSCDLSFGGKNANNDPCCFTVIGRNGGNHYILDVINKKLSFTEALERIRYLCGRYPIKKKLIEKKANGQATIDSLNREIGGFVAFDPGSKSKIERLQNCLPFFEAGNMYFPDESINSEIDDLVEQLIRFPNTTHDDFVDTLSQYLLNYEYKYGGKIATDTRFKVFADAIRGLKI